MDACSYLYVYVCVNTPTAVSAALSNVLELVLSTEYAN